MDPSLGIEIGPAWKGNSCWLDISLFILKALLIAIGGEYGWALDEDEMSADTLRIAELVTAVLQLPWTTGNQQALNDARDKLHQTYREIHRIREGAYHSVILDELLQMSWKFKSTLVNGKSCSNQDCRHETLTYLGTSALYVGLEKMGAALDSSAVLGDHFSGVVRVQDPCALCKTLSPKYRYIEGDPPMVLLFEGVKWHEGLLEQNTTLSISFANNASITQSVTSRYRMHSMMVHRRQYGIDHFQAVVLSSSILVYDDQKPDNTTKECWINMATKASLKRWLSEGDVTIDAVYLKM